MIQSANKDRVGLKSKVGVKFRVHVMQKKLLGPLALGLEMRKESPTYL